MSLCACHGGIGEVRTAGWRREELRAERSGSSALHRGTSLAPRQALRVRLLPAPQVLQHPVHVLLFAQSLKERQQVQELRVSHVIKPRLHGNLRKTQTHTHLEPDVVL